MRKHKIHRRKIPCGLLVHKRHLKGGFAGINPETISHRRIYPVQRSPRVHAKVKYYKNSSRYRSPATFNAVEPQGVGGDIYAVIKEDPILKRKRERDLKRAVERHEKDEIHAWGKGSFFPHQVAKGRETNLTKEMQTPQDFWREVDRRERGMK